MSRLVPRLAIETDHELLDGYARFCAALGLCDGGLRDRLSLARAFPASIPTSTPGWPGHFPLASPTCAGSGPGRCCAISPSRARSASTSTCSWPRTRAASG